MNNKINKELIEKYSIPLETFKNRNPNTKNQNNGLYHLLCQPLTFVNAYSKISKNLGALTKGYKDEAIMQYFGKINA